MSDPADATSIFAAYAVKLNSGAQGHDRKGFCLFCWANPENTAMGFNNAACSTHSIARLDACGSLTKNITYFTCPYSSPQQLVKARLLTRAYAAKVTKRQTIEGQRALARSIGIGLGSEIFSAEAELGVNYAQAVEKVLSVGQYLSA